MVELKTRALSRRKQLAGIFLEIRSRAIPELSHTARSAGLMLLQLLHQVTRLIGIKRFWYGRVNAISSSVP